MSKVEWTRRGVEYSACLDCWWMHRDEGEPAWCEEFEDQFLQTGGCFRFEERLGRNICDTVKGHCEFKCSICGATIDVVEGGDLDGGYFRYCPGCGARLEEEVKPWVSP